MPNESQIPRSDKSAIEDLEFPEILKDKLKYLSDQFPNNVDLDKEDWSVIFREEMPRDVGVAFSNLRYVADINEVIENLNLLIEDIKHLPNMNYDELDIYERRYHLYTKIFFYELLRVRDILGRHLKRSENLGLTTKKQRKSSKKLLDEQFEEHYLIRNVYLHGHKHPLSKKEQDLNLMTLFYKSGFKPELVPKNGDETIKFFDTLKELCDARAIGLTKIGTDVRKLLDSILHTMSTWENHKVKEGYIAKDEDHINQNKT